jgi:DNA-binding HxlR family transcriptional regulator
MLRISSILEIPYKVARYVEYTMSETSHSELENAIQFPSIKFKDCPVKVAMNVLGKKWTVLILRNIAFFKIERFNELRRSLPGLTPRVLIMRLHELEECGIIQAVILKDKPRLVKWVLTKKGQDVIPILLSIVAFGAKWYSEQVFDDNRPRTINEIYPKLTHYSKRANAPSETLSLVLRFR